MQEGKRKMKGGFIRNKDTGTTTGERTDTGTAGRETSYEKVYDVPWSGFVKCCCNKRHNFLETYYTLTY